MNSYVARQKRGAVNVEYILLIVVGALAVVMGLTTLGGAMNGKFTAIADNLTGGSGILSNAVITSDTVTWSGGKSPFRVMRSAQPDMSDGVEVGTTPDQSITLVPEVGDNYYQIKDADGVVSNIVIAHKDAPVVVVPPITDVVVTNNTITWSGGKSPFRVMRSPQPDMSGAVEVGTTPNQSLDVAPETGNNYYQIIDGGDTLSAPINIPRSALTAKVYDEHGELLSNVNVVICAVDDTKPNYGLLTDATGSRTFSDLQAGRYTLTTQVSGYVDQTTQVTLATAEARVWNFSLVKSAPPVTTGSLTINTRNALNKPTALRVLVTSAAGYNNSGQSSNAAGVLTLTDLPAGVYSVSCFVSPASTKPVTVIVGQEVAVTVAQR